MQLCREFHCLPGQLRQQRADDILNMLTMMSAEAHVRQLKRNR